ncbi:MAG TPA: efflux RND transporter periplasmic adaptor subunit [Candidatus Acidoferrales bacterium]|nr:efflux RND transporter periplasmic adaptor subunit [Candidatus Acidoferrales bacterium]
MKTPAILLLIAAAFVGGYGYGRWYAKPAAVAGSATGSPKVLYWQDPMHPWYKSDKPGTAPDCGMKLVPVYAGAETGAPAGAAAKEASQSAVPGGDRKVLYWVDAMNPSHKSDKPGTAPDGMKLVPVYAEAGAKSESNGNQGAVQITPQKQQLIGVEFGTAEYESVTGSIHAAARVTLDETRIAKVQSRLEGWIDQLFVDFTGKQVNKGDALLTIYSPEAVATQMEYLLAIKAQHTMLDNPLHEMMDSTQNLVAAAKKRMELWDISDRQIEQVAATSQPLQNLTLYSPISGFVMERNAFAKQRVTPEMVLYTVADLSRVWVIADVFEFESANVRLNQPATLTVASQPGRTFHGRVSYILPQVDPIARTLKVRIAFDNPGLALKPDMYGEVDLQTGGTRKLVAPLTAVLNSGQQQRVFVDKGNGYFEPRDVKTGAQMDNRVEILSGLKAGERIVISGNFLMDSESRLK